MYHLDNFQAITVNLVSSVGFAWLLSVKKCIWAHENANSKSSRIGINYVGLNELISSCGIGFENALY